jgi:NADH-quinone oxidoreductase subunit L
MEVGLMLISLVVAILGIYLANRMYLVRPDLAKRVADKLPGFYRLLSNKFNVDEAYDALFVIPLKTFSQVLWTRVDIIVVDGLVNGIAKTFQAFSGYFRNLQTGYAKTYLLSMLVGVLAITLFYTWR